MSDHHNVNTAMNANRAARTWDEWFKMGYGIMLDEAPVGKNEWGLDIWTEGQIMKLSRMQGHNMPRPA